MRCPGVELAPLPVWVSPGRVRRASKEKTERASSQKKKNQRQTRRKKNSVAGAEAGTWPAGLTVQDRAPGARELG